mgnify:CR=1 FL=1|jgi:protein-disulfide isomerase
MQLSFPLLARRMLISSPLLGLAFALQQTSGAFAQEQGQSPAPTDPERARIEAVIHDYIMQNPEVIVEALQQMQERQRLAAEEHQRSQVAALRAELESSAGSPVMGNPQGDVTIVEFFDYRCPYCQRVVGMLQDTLRADGNVRLVLKEWPILGPESVVASRAALAAGLQGKYETLHVALLEFQGELTQDSIMAIAKANGLDVERLREDMEDPSVTAEITRNTELAARLAIRGTPAFVIGDSVIPGAISPEQLQDYIAKSRASSG